MSSSTCAPSVASRGDADSEAPSSSTATSVQSLPPLTDSVFWDKGCSRCGLTRRSPNPLRHKYAGKTYLPWRRFNGSECVPCAYYISLAYPTVEQKKAMTTKVKMSDAEMQTYRQGREQWIKMHNNSAAGRVKKTALDMDLKIQVETNHGFRAVENCGVWWPKQMAIDAGLDIKKETITHIGGDDGTPRRAGVVRDSEHGCPTGCVRLEKYMEKSAKKIELKGSASSELRAGQTDDAFKAIVSANHVKAFSFGGT
jgi:hypothetical protein